MSSLESVGSEAVQFLSFANTYMTKNGMGTGQTKNNEKIC